MMYNDEELKKIQFTNIIKMLNARQKINNNDNLDNIMEDLYRNYNNVEETTNININGKKIYIKFIYMTLMTIKNKSSSIRNFLEKEGKKILLVNDVKPTAIKQILQFDDVEVFNMTFFNINLIDNVLVPKHIRLNEEEKNKVIKEYTDNIQQFKVLCIDDPVSKYYNYKVGDLVRIERPSVATGISTDYRVVSNILMQI